LWALSRLQQPIVTIFGGCGTDKKDEDKYEKKAYHLGAMLVQHHFSVVTGGGPGIMEAANCGAVSIYKNKQEQCRWTFGVGVKGVNGGHHNPCAQVIFVRYFFIRKWLLTRYSSAYIVFPGGIGTADEFFELLDLLRHKKFSYRPVILVGKEYWSKLLDWYTHSAKKEGFITPEREVPFTVTDNNEEIIQLIMHQK